MALITRLTRLLQADMHSVLDAIEEPALLLKQSIREMEESVAADEKQIRLWEHEQQQQTNKHDQLAVTLTDLEEKCVLCFKSNKDDLARPFIKRRLEAQRAKQLLAEKITALQEKISRLTHQLTVHQAQLAAMGQKAEVFLEEGAINTTHWENPSVSVRDEDVEVAFLQEKQKWSAS
ncbi:MAG: PspA/IM30 family protein [Gammaproteobacteria bacterium]